MSYGNFLVNPLSKFICTVFFSVSPKLIFKLNINTYYRCFSSGIILSLMIFYIFIDLYQITDCLYPKLISGLAFYSLFFLEKSYLDIHYNYTVAAEKPTKLQALIFTLALSIHLFFKGIKLGFLGNYTSLHVILFIIYKSLESFSLSISVVYSDFNRIPKMLLVVLYSISNPLGIVFSKYKDSYKMFKIIENIMVGISSGMFFYIGFIEMLNSEFRYKHNLSVRIKKLMLITLSFILMSGFFLFCSQF